MSGFVETQMDDADRAGVDYSLATEPPAICAPCEAGDHGGCPGYGPEGHWCECRRGDEHRRWSEEHFFDGSRMAEVEGLYQLDLEHDLGDPLWEDRRTALGTYQERQNGGLSQADLPLTPADRARMGIPEEE
jgi:hypothetical protein